VAGPDSKPPDQVELGAITSAIHAAMGYSPVMAAPKHHEDIYAFVTKNLAERFWRDIYVDRPQIREIIFHLETGQLVIISGERGTGKTTAIRSALHELDTETDGDSSSELPENAAAIINHVVDANNLTAVLMSPDTAFETIHKEVFNALINKAIDDRGAWLPYLYAHNPSFEVFKMALEQDMIFPSTPREWREAAGQERYEHAAVTARDRFTSSPYSERLRTLLEYIAERTPFEPLVIVDNLDHLDNPVQVKCAVALCAVIRSSTNRVRGAIAVRPENVEAIERELDTTMGPPEVPLIPALYRHEGMQRPTIEMTLSFIARRIALLQEPETVARIFASIDPAKAEQLAQDTQLVPNPDASGYFDVLMEMLHFMVYDVFTPYPVDRELLNDNADFGRALHAWHNGSLRECGLSLTTFVSDILQDKTHMSELRGLLMSVMGSRSEPVDARRRRMRRLTRSLLYRHLLSWGSRGGRPPKNVLVFAGTREDTEPPLHFLPLRILQHLATRQNGRTTVKGLRRVFALLDVEHARTDEAVRELAEPRTLEDTGLIRIDGSSRLAEDADLPEGASVQLQDAGSFLVETLCLSTEYMFWSAVTQPSAAAAVEMGKRPAPKDIQDDAFRARMASRFVERYVIGKLREEHPYLEGVTKHWTRERAKARLSRYEQYFGFSKGHWFLDSCCDSMFAFLPARGRSEEFRDTKEALDRIRRFARTLDAVVADGPVR
jgi:energy-coupling factor transporter ATP-binding protein EcfA2